MITTWYVHIIHIMYFLCCILVVLYSPAYADNWILACGGRPFKVPQIHFYPNKINVIHLNYSSKETLKPNFASFMKPEQMSQITEIKITGCRPKSMVDLDLSNFRNLDTLYLNHMSLDNFDFELLKSNKLLRKLDLNDNPNLSKLYGRAGVELRILNLENTRLETFPKAIMQFEDSLLKLNISGNIDGTSGKELCAKFKKLEYYNGKHCRVIKNGFDFIKKIQMEDSKSDLIMSNMVLLLLIQIYFLW